MQFEKIIFDGNLFKFGIFILIALLFWAVSNLVNIYISYFKALREIKRFKIEINLHKNKLSGFNPYEDTKYSRKKHHLMRNIFGELWNIRYSKKIKNNLNLCNLKVDYVDDQIKKIFYKKRLICQFICLFSILMVLWGITYILFSVIKGFNLTIDKLSFDIALKVLSNHFLDMKPILLLAYCDVFLSVWAIISTKALAQFILFEISELKVKLCDNKTESK